MFFVFLSLLLCVFGPIPCAFYRAAVVEMMPRPGHNSSDANMVLTENLGQVHFWVERAAKENAQLVVFPEDALTAFEFQNREDFYPFLSRIPEKGTELCENELVQQDQEDQETVDVLGTLGCIAKMNNIVVVIDIGELDDCRKEEYCPPDDHWQFSTQVVIDENGLLIGRYRKYHLFIPDYQVFNQPPLLKHDIDRFETSFGEKFGQFICFDLFFRAPEWILAENFGIEHFTFSTYWVNDGSMPPITATSLQQGFSRASGTNLLASNIGFGKWDSGSGIYASGEPIHYFVNPIPDVPDEFMLVADLPTSGGDDHQTTKQRPPPTQEHKPKVTHVEQHVEQHHLPHQHQDIPTQGGGGDVETFPSESNLTRISFSSKGSYSTSVSNGPVSCSVDATLSEDSNETYALAAINGTLFDGLLPTQMCAFFLCAGSVDYQPPGWEGCSLFPFTSKSVFESVTLKMDGIQTVGKPIPIAYSTRSKLFSYEKEELVFDHVDESQKASLTMQIPSTLVSIVIHSQYIHSQ